MSEMSRLELLSPEECVILQLLKRENLTPWELARKSPLGMRETQAIVGYLIRKGFVSNITPDVPTFLQITPRGMDFINHAE